MMSEKGEFGGYQKYFKYFTTRNIFIALFVLGLVLRLLYVNAGIPHFDSIADALRAPLSLEQKTIVYSYGYGSPGMVVLLTVVFFFDKLITGATTAEFAYFFITLITAALSISMMYLVMKKLTKNELIGIFSALFLCVTPIYLSVTTYPKSHSPATFFVLLAGYYLLRAADGDKDELKFIIYSGILFSFATSIRVFSFVFIIPFALIYLNPRLVANKKSQSLVVNKHALKPIHIGAFIASLFIVVFVLFIPRFLDIGLSGFLANILGEKTTVTARTPFSERFSLAINFLHISVTWLGWVAVVLGGFFFYKKDKLKLIALTLGFFLFFYIFVRFGNVDARFILPALIMLTMFMGAGVYVVYANNNKAGLIFAAALIIWMFMAIQPIISARHEYSGQKEFAMFVAENTEPNALIMTNDEGFFLEFYTSRQRLTPPRPWEGQTLEGFMAKLITLSSEGVPLYITSTGQAYGFGESFYQALQQFYDVAFVGERPNEAYSQNTLQFQIFNEQLYKLIPKNETLENFQK